MMCVEVGFLKKVLCSLKSFHEQSRKVRESGTAVIEFALTAIFLVPLMVGIIDISLLLFNYSKLQQGAREGVRAASRIAIINPNVSYTNLDTSTTLIGSCNSLTPPAATSFEDCAHANVHAQVRTVLLNEQLMRVTVDAPLAGPPAVAGTDIVTLFNQAGSGNDSFEVSVTGEFRGFLATYPMSVTYEGPWLF